MRLLDHFTEVVLIDFEFIGTPASDRSRSARLRGNCAAAVSGGFGRMSSLQHPHFRRGTIPSCLIPSLGGTGLLSHAWLAYAGADRGLVC